MELSVVRENSMSNGIAAKNYGTLQKEKNDKYGYFKNF